MPVLGRTVPSPGRIVTIALKVGQSLQCAQKWMFGYLRLERVDDDSEQGRAEVLEAAWPLSDLMPSLSSRHRGRSVAEEAQAWLDRPGGQV
jgi:hypothetical protein